MSVWWKVRRSLNHEGLQHLSWQSMLHFSPTWPRNNWLTTNNPTLTVLCMQSGKKLFWLDYRDGVSPLHIPLDTSGHVCVNIPPMCMLPGLWCNYITYSELIVSRQSSPYPRQALRLFCYHAQINYGNSSIHTHTHTHWSNDLPMWGWQASTWHPNSVLNMAGITVIKSFVIIAQILDASEHRNEDTISTFLLRTAFMSCGRQSYSWTAVTEVTLHEILLLAKKVLSNKTNDPEVNCASSMQNPHQSPEMFTFNITTALLLFCSLALVNQHSTELH